MYDTTLIPTFLVQWYSSHESNEFGEAEEKEEIYRPSEALPCPGPATEMALATMPRAAVTT